jgi:agmatine deiminase
MSERSGDVKKQWVVALLAFLAGILVCAVVLLVAFPKVKEALIEKELIGYLSDEPMPLPYHTLNQSSLRIVVGEAIPELYTELTQPMLERLMGVVQETYPVHLETAQNPPSSDEEMVTYLDSTGVLAELDLDWNTAYQDIQAIDATAHHFEPLGSYTQYHYGSPPADPVRLPAEFEEIGAVTLGWPVYYPYMWQHFADFTDQIVSQAWAYVVVPNESWQKGVELFLAHKEVPLDKVRFMYVQLDDVWSRDYGPSTVESGPSHRPVLVANPYFPNGTPYQKGDAEVPLAMGRYLGVPVYRLPLVIEGGNVQSDGQGTFIMFDSVLYHNPDYTVAKLKHVLGQYFGCERLILLPTLSDELCGHIDMVVKIVDPGTVLVAQSQPKFKWYGEFEAIAERMAETPSATGENYEVVRVPMADDSNDSINFWSYVNSLILNDKVIVPQFGLELDQQALEIYGQAMPDHEVVGVYFGDFPLGASHCTSKEIPATLTDMLAQ